MRFFLHRVNNSTADHNKEQGEKISHRDTVEINNPRALVDVLDEDAYENLLELLEVGAAILGPVQRGGKCQNYMVFSNTNEDRRVISEIVDALKTWKEIPYWSLSARHLHLLSPYIHGDIISYDNKDGLSFIFNNKMKMDNLTV